MNVNVNSYIKYAKKLESGKFRASISEKKKDGTYLNYSIMSNEDLTKFQDLYMHIEGFIMDISVYEKDGVSKPQVAIWVNKISEAPKKGKLPESDGDEVPF